MLQETHVGDCHCVASGLVAYRHLSKPEMNEKMLHLPCVLLCSSGMFLEKSDHTASVLWKLLSPLICVQVP